MNVLVVDDVGYMRHFLQRLLEQHGHTAYTASSGIDGLKILQHDLNIDCIICDLLMPDMNGIEFFKRAQLIERVTDQGAVPPPPFILLTALRPDDTSRKSEVALLRQADEVGFAEVMWKPVDQKGLIKKLAEFEAGNSEAANSTVEVRELQKTIQSLTDAVDSGEHTPAKDALLATLQTLKTQLADLKTEPAENEAVPQETPTVATP